MSHKANNIYFENQIEFLDQELDQVLKLQIKNITDYLIAHYSGDQIHIMQRLLRQRGENKTNAHLISLLKLAESIKRTI